MKRTPQSSPLSPQFQQNLVRVFLNFQIIFDKFLTKKKKPPKRNTFAQEFGSGADSSANSSPKSQNFENYGKDEPILTSNDDFEKKPTQTEMRMFKKFVNYYNDEKQQSFEPNDFQLQQPQLQKNPKSQQMSPSNENAPIKHSPSSNAPFANDASLKFFFFFLFLTIFNFF